MLPAEGVINLAAKGWYVVIFQASVDPDVAKRTLSLNQEKSVTVRFTHNGITDRIIYIKAATSISTNSATLFSAQRIVFFDAWLKRFFAHRRHIPLGEALAADLEQDDFAESSGQLSLLTIASGQRYSHLHSQLAIADRNIVFVDDGTVVLTKGSIERLAQFFPTHDFISFDYYAKLESDEYMKPQFTPELNLPYLFCYDYIRGCYFVSREILKRALNSLPSDAEYHQHELLLAIVTERTISPKRVANLSALRAFSHPKKLDVDKLGLRVRAILPNASIAIKTPGIYKLSLSPPERTSVSIIIPAKDQLEYTRRCVDSILEKTTGVNFEIVIVNNDSSESEMLAWLDRVAEDQRVRILNYPYPFNFSAINNFAVSHVKHDYLMFLNNDTEVISEHWLSEMIGWASVEGIGAVGCKLLYEDNRIQHAGVVVGIQGAAAHVHRYYHAEHPGYMHRLECSQFYSAVTAAALAIKKSNFLDAGGFDEIKYRVAYNDVDLCLKCVGAGLSNVWLSDVHLYHYESKSRLDDLGLQQIPRYSRELSSLRKDWNVINYNDPCYNPNLSEIDEYFH
ncbi:glycosyl transferase, group 2 family protein [marine gamma proteobacterium HTCC2143]|uniref:Glycosyl transferase, group 2 family protein n=1 Tax=marine gamma proteobacterium HTCC2143 TaxID=247633 RepID=A0Y9H0_9GAMM|nr:glycosyl transferase, group 2 family protein [marine gamma proteobacterium HTCC2143]